MQRATAVKVRIPGSLEHSFRSRPNTYSGGQQMNKPYYGLQLNLQSKTSGRLAPRKKNYWTKAAGATTALVPMACVFIGK